IPGSAWSHVCTIQAPSVACQRAGQSPYLSRTLLFLALPRVPYPPYPYRGWYGRDSASLFAGLSRTSAVPCYGKLKSCRTGSLFHPDKFFHFPVFVLFFHYLEHTPFDVLCNYHFQALALVLVV